MGREGKSWVVLGLAVCAGLTSPLHAAKYKIRWLIGHPNVDFFEEAAASFKQTVERESRGDIAVEIETAPNNWESAGRPAPGAQVAERVARGEAQMGHSFTDVMGGFDHRFWAFDLPFLFKDYNHLERVVEGPIGAEMLDGLKSKQLKGLAFTFSGGANVLSSRSTALRTPADLKGLRVAVFGDEVDRAWLSSLGAIPVPIRHDEESIPGLTDRAAIDGAVLTWRRHYRLGRTARGYGYGSLEGSSYLVSATYVNETFFESLPPAYRSLISKAAREAGRIERARTVELNELCKRRLTSKGVREVAVSEENRRAFETALRPVYEKTLEPLVGKDLIERIRKAGSEAELASAPGR